MGLLKDKKKNKNNKQLRNYVKIKEKELKRQIKYNIVDIKMYLERSS